jgi:hypothetical protein
MTAPLPHTSWRFPEAPRPSRFSSPGTAAPFLFLLALALLAPPAAGRPAWAGWSVALQPDGRAICTGREGWRDAQVVVPDGAGGWLIFTEDTYGETNFLAYGETDLFLIHLDRDFGHLPIGDLYRNEDPCGALILGGRGETHPNDGIPWGDGTALLAVAESGNFEAGDHPHVLLRVFDASGRSVLDQPPAIPPEEGRETDWPRLAAVGSGGFLVSWVDRPYGSLTNPRLLLLRFDAAGRSLWPRPTIVSQGEDIPGYSVSLAADGTGGAWLSWTEWRDQGANRGYFPWVTHIGPDGVTGWPTGGVRPTPDAEAGYTTPVVPCGDGALVAYPGDGMRVQKFASDGTRLWGDTGLRLSDRDHPPFGLSSDPQAVAAPEGGVYVAWKEHGSARGDELLLQRVLPDGTAAWAGPLQVASTPLLLYPGAPAVLADGSIALVWLRLDLQNSNLFTQVIDRRGRIRGPAGGATISSAIGNETNAAIIVPPPDASAPAAEAAAPEAIFLWTDNRTAGLWGYSESLYLQRASFFSTPSLAPPAPVQLRQDAVLDVDWPGDDLQPGLLVEAGAGVIVEEAIVAPISTEGPGDLLHLRLRADAATPPGPRDLRLLNPDGGALLTPGVLSVGLDPHRIDLDRSGRVDGYDLAVLAHAFGRGAGEVAYSLAADIDVSGVVDGDDLALLATRFGGPPEPAQAADGGVGVSAR